MYTRFRKSKYENVRYKYKRDLFYNKTNEFIVKSFNITFRLPEMLK